MSAASRSGRAIDMRHEGETVALAVRGRWGRLADGLAVVAVVGIVGFVGFIASMASAHADPLRPEDTTARDEDGRYAERIRSFETSRPADWQPLVLALAANPTVRSVFDEADAAGIATASPRTRSRFIGAVIWVVANGLRRADDADLIVVRPLVRKIMSAARCVRDDPPVVVTPGKIMIDEEAAGLQAVFTRAVVAINAQRPPLPVDPVDLAAAGQRSAAQLDDDERALLQAVFAGAPHDVPSCRLVAAMNKLRFDGPAADTPIMLRKALSDFPSGLREPRPYAASDAPTYPPEALRAGVTGTQRVRFTIAADGHLQDVTFRSSVFDPAEVPLANGELVRSSALFDDEIRAYLAATHTRYSARPKDGQPAETIYELPFNWTIAEERPDRP